MLKRKSRRGLGSVETILSRVDDVPKLAAQNDCKSALTTLIYAHEDYAQIPLAQRFNDTRLHNVGFKLESAKNAFTKHCLRSK